MHTIDHHRTVVKLGAWMSLLHSVGFPYEDKVGKYGWAGEDPPPKALGDMELGWVLGVEVAMTRQLFAAPSAALQHVAPGPAARMADGQGGCSK